MTTPKKRNSYLHQVRRYHRFLAPIMLLPLLLTLVTGSIYQLVDLAGQGDSFDWLLDLHKGHFGVLNLEIIYPFLNALGLLGLALTGTTLWLQTQRNLKT
jgi:uncharacterized iron-regulated membrane protein